MSTPRRGRPPKAPEDKASTHFGLKMTAAEKSLLDTLVADEQQKLGPYVTVSVSSFLKGLVMAEAMRRWPTEVRAAFPGQQPVKLNIQVRPGAVHELSQVDVVLGKDDALIDRAHDELERGGRRPGKHAVVEKEALNYDPPRVVRPKKEKPR